MLNDEQQSAAAFRRAVKASPQSNRLIAQVGYMNARHMSPGEISAALGRQLSPPEIEELWRRYEFMRPVLLPGHERIEVALSAKHRTKLAREAMARGMELPAFTAALLSRTAEDALFAALMDR